MKTQCITWLALGCFLFLGSQALSGEKVDAQAKEAADRFMKAFLAKDVDAMMKVSDVPYFNRSKLINERDALDKLFRKIVKEKSPPASKFKLVIKLVAPLSKFEEVWGKKVRDDVEGRKDLEKVLGKEHRVIHADFHIEDRKEDDAIFLVRFVEGKAKVVGFIK